MARILIGNVEEMKASDRYLKWVEWSDEDQTYIGKCPDLITGIHGDDPVTVYGELCDVVEEVIPYFSTEGRVLPSPCLTKQDPTGIRLHRRY